MIYTNLFKPNKGEIIKTKVHYMVESRKYKINIIFDKKFTSLLSAITIGFATIGLVNLGIYVITTSGNARRLASLEEENSMYLSSLSQLENQQKTYLSHKSDADNIYNISEKPTKWSSIIELISEQLPYDTVLTTVETVTEEEVKLNSSPDGENDSSNNNNNNNEDSNSNNKDDSVEVDPDKEPTLEEQIEENKNITINNTLHITGKSLSMVNLSLFLDKLDKLDIFSKVECTSAIKDDDSIYYTFTIYAYLN